MRTRGTQLGASIAHSIGETSAREGWGSIVGFPLVSVYYVNTYYSWLQSSKHTQFSFEGLTESVLFDTVTTRHFVTALKFYESKWKKKIKCDILLMGSIWSSQRSHMASDSWASSGHLHPHTGMWDTCGVCKLVVPSHRMGKAKQSSGRGSLTEQGAMAGHQAIKLYHINL